MISDKYGRFEITNNFNNKGANTTMNKKEQRMETLKTNGINTNNFFNLNMDIPVGANVVITIDGVPYSINSSNDNIVKSIIETGYIYNQKTDGRFVCAETFKMLKQPSYNWKTRQYETGWDAYLRNNYVYMYQFDMMLDEVHKLAKMERGLDPDFEKMSSFFTKEVIFNTCNHYIGQLKKFVKNQPTRRCKGEPYAKLNKYGNVFHKDLYNKVYWPLEMVAREIAKSYNYTIIEKNLKLFVDLTCKLPAETPKCSTWKDAFKGKGAFMTLNNIIKQHFHLC